MVLVFLIAEEIICKSPPVLFSSSAAYTVSSPEGGKEKKRMLIDTIALVLTIIGAINWLLVGVFQLSLIHI